MNKHLYCLQQGCLVSMFSLYLHVSFGIVVSPQNPLICRLSGEWLKCSQTNWRSGGKSILTDTLLVKQSHLLSLPPTLNVCFTLCLQLSSCSVVHNRRNMPLYASPAAVWKEECVYASVVRVQIRLQEQFELALSSKADEWIKWFPEDATLQSSHCSNVTSQQNAVLKIRA